jgi:hypothetical protein
MRNTSRAALCVLLASPFLVSAQDKLLEHNIRLDTSGKIIPWVTPQDKAYEKVVGLAWDFLLNQVPLEKNGLKTYYSYCCMNLKTMRGTGWPNNPACVYAGLTDGSLAWYAYSGDRKPVEMVQQLLDYQLAHGTTPVGWTWGGIPYASANHGDTEYRGAYDLQYNSERLAVGDGYGVIEPDKVGELGLAYLKFWKFTGETRYRDAALSCANALAKNIRTGEWGKSPWPFRVFAEQGRVREEYTGNVIGPIRLFDEMQRLGVGDASAYKKARDAAWGWMMAYPMKNMLWSAYFEDVFFHAYPNNLNQYSPMETARYLMEHPELDPDWKTHVPQLIAFVERTFAVDVPNEPAVQWGANAISEQIVDMNKMGSHTSRYASVNALWSSLTGDAAAKEKAYRSFNWATYMCRENGFVHVGPVDQSLWFSDGYADYIRHFLAGMAAVPEWSPTGENHLVRSSSLVTKAEYTASRIAYSTYGKDSVEVLRLKSAPASVSAGGKPLVKSTSPNGPGWTWDPAKLVLVVRHTGASDVVIILESGHS